MPPSRRLALVALFALLAALSAYVLGGVLSTVFFAVTVAYVLFPLRRRLVARGFSRRLASVAVTALAFLGLFAVVSPLSYVLYRRRSVVVDLLRELPDELVLEVAGFRYVLPTAPLLDAARETIASVALTAASAAPVLTLKAFLFALLVYGLLYKPGDVRRAVYGFVPTEYHGVVDALHERVRSTLLAIYVLQAATAVGTGLVAFVVFVLLGYGSALTLAIVAAVLQFVPVVGPSVLVVALAVVDLVGGDVQRAVLVVVLGLTLVGFLPDAVIRPRLAGIASDLPVSLYFVGFVGGVLSVGPIGFVAGPLVVALLVEVVSLLSAEADATDSVGAGGEAAVGAESRPHSDSKTS
ncbi:AI-2E family transporter [Halobium salinum]|uniref:AI-2E family transporter n=1 Tax=Halobium salinum TaxID=1364940 RepID=A0ABD5PFN6_9EURY|nr:AI-2E family transporter [Halobium salinum]